MQTPFSADTGGRAFTLPSLSYRSESTFYAYLNLTRATDVGWRAARSGVLKLKPMNDSIRASENDLSKKMRMACAIPQPARVPCPGRNRCKFCVRRAHQRTISDQKIVWLDGDFGVVRVTLLGS